MISKKIPYEFIDKLKKMSFIDEIWLYGSRARDSHQERSDIDLAIICPKASKDDWIEILKVIEEKDTLLQVDAVRYDEIKDIQFKKRIEKEKIVLYKK